MHYAASYGYLDICQKFIEIDNEQRSFIDIANANKETPLHLAANNHHLDICQFLIDNGAIIDAKVF
ncbi:hypothetical protein TRFO_12663 [Tritrichomonas foetus]|uniref:Uncharacterized protein n=1 Tax=Tritrichomonas foetus TaxID=1144522 RepID=A0A1J4L5C0_9EUKA|nr:hypothetical protein TRFO_12663 [Tritrichomonas foetus]|eukprot:OHT17134.1 hypothetical protein TRFO_12663 [Tritrichomonas foetus]